MPKTALDWLAYLYATVGGIGLLRPAPGTWGSVPGFLIFAGLLAIAMPTWAIALFTLVTLALSIPAADRTARIMDEKDPGAIVADEAFSVPVALWPLAFLPSISILWWLVAFVLYRFFDIVKIWPARQLEKWPGGLGIVIDDVASAVWCSAVLGIAVWFAVN